MIQSPPRPHAARANGTAAPAAELPPLDPAWGVPPPPEAPGGSPFRLLGYLKHHWVLLTFLGSALAAALAFAAYSLIPAKYTTYSLLRVSLQPQRVAFRTGEAVSRNDFSTYVRTQAQLIKSRYVLTAALRDPEVARLPMLKSQVDPERFLEEELRVDYQDGSEIIKIVLDGDDPEQITRVVNAVQGAYMKEIIEKEQDVKADQLRTLRDILQDMERRLKEGYKALAQTEEPVVVTDAGDVKRSNQIALAQVVRLRDTLFQLESEIASLTRRAEALRGKLEAPPPANPAEDIALAQAIESDPAYRELGERIEKLQSRLEYYRSITSDPNSPRVAAVRDALAEATAKRDAMRQQTLAKAQELRLHAHRTAVRQELEAAEAELRDRQERKKLAEEAVAKYEGSITAVEQEQAKLESPDFLKADIQHREELLHRIINEAHLQELEVNAPPRVQPLQAAAVPLKKEYKKQLLGTGFAGLMGYLVVAMGIVAYESRVRRVMSLDDVRRVAAGPVLGVIPGPPGTAGAGQGGWADSRAVLEAVDKARTQTVLQAPPGPGRTILVTSASEDEAKAFLTWKLTMSLAKAGYRTLLIDCDLREPCLHEHMGVPNERGVCEVLRGEMDPRNAIQTLGDGLCFLAAGKWCDQVRQELAGEKVAAFLGQVRGHFDCVVIHTHPILSVTDTFLIGRHADMAVLAVLRHVSRLPLVVRAQERLLALNKDAYGLVYLGASADETLV